MSEYAGSASGSLYADSVGSVTDVNSVDINIIKQILQNEQIEDAIQSADESSYNRRDRSGKGTRYCRTTSNSGTGTRSNSGGGGGSSASSYASHAEIRRRRRKLREPMVGDEYNNTGDQNPETSAGRTIVDPVPTIFADDGSNETSARVNRSFLGPRLAFLKPAGEAFPDFRDKTIRRMREDGLEPDTEKTLLAKYWRTVMEGVPFKRYVLHEIYSRGYVQYCRLQSFFNSLADRNARSYNLLIVAEHGSHWLIVHDCQFNSHNCRCVIIKEIEQQFNMPREADVSAREPFGIRKFLRRRDTGGGGTNAAEEFWKTASNRIAQFEQQFEKSQGNGTPRREVFRRLSRRTKCCSEFDTYYLRNLLEYVSAQQRVPHYVEVRGRLWSLYRRFQDFPWNVIGTTEDQWWRKKTFSAKLPVKKGTKLHECILDLKQAILEEMKNRGAKIQQQRGA